ncbi:MAG: hypothetical protein AB7K68_06085 [Bacteriovoracia bacterium]
MPSQAVGKTSRLLVKVGIGLSCLLVVAGWAIEKRAQNSGEKAVDRSPASLASPPASTLAGDLVFSPQAGQRYTYGFQRKITIRGFGDNVPTIAYGGTLTLDILSVDKQGFSAIAQAKVKEYSGKESPLVKMHLNAKGKKLELHTGQAHDEETQQYIAVTKDLLALWNFSADTDTLGKYEFRVEALPAQANFQLQKKTKLKYLNQPKTEIVSSTHWLRWDSTLSLPAELKGDEATRMGQNGAYLESFTSYHVKFQARGPSPVYTKAQMAALNHADSLTLAAGNTADNLEYGKVDWAALVEKLQRLDAMTSGERLEAFGDLVRVLRREPGSLEKVLGLLGAKDIRLGADSTLFKTIVGALATAGGAENQKALLSLYQNPECPLSGKGTILGALTTTQAAATPETVDFLRDEMENQQDPDLKSGSSYALGSSLQNARGVVADSAMASLRAQWQAAVQSGDLGAQLSVLDAIGNSGRTEFVSDLKTLVESQAQIALRAKAVFSLRFMNTGESTAVLVNHFFDADEKMRESAVQAVALAPWKEQFRNPLQACSSHEAVDRIQKECDELLRAHSQMAGN